MCIRDRYPYVLVRFSDVIYCSILRLLHHKLRYVLSSSWNHANYIYNKITKKRTQPDAGRACMCYSCEKVFGQIKVSSSILKKKSVENEVYRFPEQRPEVINNCYLQKKVNACMYVRTIYAPCTESIVQQQKGWEMLKKKPPFSRKMNKKASSLFRFFTSGVYDSSFLEI